MTGFQINWTKQSEEWGMGFSTFQTSQDKPATAKWEIAAATNSAFNSHVCWLVLSAGACAVHTRLLPASLPGGLLICIRGPPTCGQATLLNSYPGWTTQEHLKPSSVGLWSCPSIIWQEVSFKKTLAYTNLGVLACSPPLTSCPWLGTVVGVPSSALTTLGWDHFFAGTLLCLQELQQYPGLHPPSRSTPPGYSNWRLLQALLSVPWGQNHHPPPPTPIREPQLKCKRKANPQLGRKH